MSSEPAANDAAASAESRGAGPRSLRFLRSAVFWLLLGVFALEFGLFDRLGAKHHTPFYPRWNDQIQYLTESYSGYEYMQARGVGRGIVQALTNRSAQGTLHDFFTLLTFRLGGPSRGSALALNIAALIAWQAALYFAVRQVSGSRALSFASALLPLALTGPWEPIPGSAFDFRLDHLAMCGLGVCAALAAASDGFRSKSYANAFGVAVGLTLLTRFLTGTYFVLILIALIVWLSLGADRWPRLANLARAVFSAVVISAPFLWFNRETVYEYYWIGHYVGPESAIRNQHFGLGRSVAFVWGQMATRHVGLFFGLVAVVGAVWLAFLRGAESRTRIKDILVCGGIFLLAPALILMLHAQKSEVVVGALVPGLILLVSTLWIHLGRQASARALGLFASAIVVAVLIFYGRAQAKPAYSATDQQELRKVNSLADEILRRGQAGKLEEFRIAVDYITDALDAQVLRVICYERHRVIIPVNMTLPTSIAEPDEATVFERLAQSDFVFVTEEPAGENFPYDHKLATLRPKVLAWCDAHLRVANQFTLFGRRMRLYQRREIPFP